MPKRISKATGDKLTPHEVEVIACLRHRGFACIIWNPEELKEANPRKVEDRSVELGWGIIEDLQ